MKQKKKLLNINNNYIFVFAHGQTEKYLFEYIGKALKLKIYVITNGNNSIQVEGISKYLNSKYSTLEKYNQKTNGKMCEFGNENASIIIYTVLDLDDSDNEQVYENYKSKSMFEGYFLYDKIRAIYNQKNLEDVLHKAGIYDHIPSNNEKMKMIERCFPSNGNKAEPDFIKETAIKISKVKGSNMGEMINELIKLAEVYSIKRTKNNIKR